MSVARCDILVIGGSVTGCGAAPTSGRGLLGRWLRLKQRRATTVQRSPEPGAVLGSDRLPTLPTGARLTSVM